MVDRMDGLYVLKPWYAARLAPLRERLIAAHISPTAVSASGVVVASGAAASLALLPPGPVAACSVGALLAARLACANLDGGIARATGRCSARGAIANETSDRIADLVVIAACCAFAPVALVVAAALGALLPAAVSVGGQLRGLPRRQGGPVGKTERAGLIVVIAATGLAVPVLVVIGVGSALTAALRLRWVRRQLAGCGV